MRAKIPLLIVATAGVLLSGCASTQNDFTYIPPQTLGRGSPGADHYYPDNPQSRPAGPLAGVDRR